MSDKDWKDDESYDIPEGEFAVYGTVYTYPEHADKVEAVYKETTRLSQTDKTTIYYCLGRDQKDPTIFYFFEQYKSKAAFLEHNDSDLIKKFLDANWIKDVKAVFVKPITPSEDNGAAIRAELGVDS